MVKRIFYKTVILTTLMMTAVTGTAQNTSPEHTPPVRDANGYDSAWYKMPANTPQNTHFEFDLKGYVFGIRMIKASYQGVIDDGRYTVRASLNTSGLGALLKKLKIWAITDGRYDQTGLYPQTHTQQNLDKKNRRVEMNYDYDAKKVDIQINPRLGSQGVPPATRQERFTADDTLSAILNLMMRQSADAQKSHLNAPLCEGEVNVFDSKQHYALRMVKDGTDKKKFLGKKTDIIRCNVYYVPISGFDPEDLPSRKEAETPVKIYMVKSPELGMYVPSRFSYKISGFTAVIKVTDMRVNGVSLKK